MADFNAINRPQLGAGIGRLFGVDRARIGVLSSEIVLTTSPWERPEFWALLGGSLWSAFYTCAANVGIQSQACVYNPVNSGVLCIVEGFTIQNAQAAVRTHTWGLAQGVVPLSVLSTMCNRDLRRANVSALGAMASVIRVSVPAGAGAIYAPSLGSARIAADGTYTTPPNYEVILPPGWGMIITGAVNEVLTGMFWGRERPRRTLNFHCECLRWTCSSASSASRMALCKYPAGRSNCSCHICPTHLRTTSPFA